MGRHMSSGWHELTLFFGRFHVLVVHLPIGGLVLLGVLELLAGGARFKDAAQNRGLILGFTAGGSVAAALCGWALAPGGDYDPKLLQWHRWTGLAVAATCLLAWLLQWLGHPRSYRLCLAATLAVLIVAGHLGASLTHGRDLLSRYAPAPLRWLLGETTGPAAATPTILSPLQERVFAEVVQPILAQRCGDCHGSEQQKAGLRVDSLQALAQGGHSGPAFVAGNASASPLLKRMLLPLEHEDHMPPEGKPQPTTAELTTLQWWIEGAAPSASQGANETRP